MGAPAARRLASDCARMWRQCSEGGRARDAERECCRRGAARTLDAPLRPHAALFRPP